MREARPGSVLFFMGGDASRWLQRGGPFPPGGAGGKEPTPGYSAPVLDAQLRFQGVRRRFGRLSVLEGVSGAVDPGQAVLVTGPNGSGKSTLL
ncbi:MAG TPA: ATP-binding cassette domain-containing protein, partial [Thermoanaerobaculia bacterium]|nr:ATP-binding cassette domain-containing protein [Thermoanaerobaculia bacterium]